MKYAYICERGGRAINEDSVLVMAENGKLAAVVADGLGSCGGGKKASETVIKTISDNFDKLTSLNSEMINKVLEQANRNIICEQTKMVKMKSTVAVLAADTDNRQYIWAYIGDSRLYHFVNGRIISYTKDHSVSQIKAAMGEITEAQIRSDTDRNRLVRALGTGADKIKPAISSLYTVTNKYDTNAFLLCSDGFWQYVLEKEMEDTLCLSHSPDEWLGAMKEILSSRCGNGCDNYSAIVLME